jgi:hypothetical protein
LEKLNATSEYVGTIIKLDCLTKSCVRDSWLNGVSFPSCSFWIYDLDWLKYDCPGQLSKCTLSKSVWTIVLVKPISHCVIQMEKQFFLNSVYVGGNMTCNILMVSLYSRVFVRKHVILKRKWFINVIIFRLDFVKQMTRTVENLIITFCLSPIPMHKRSNIS